jgi:hypothetical protein
LEWVAGPGAPYAAANGWSGKDVGIDLVAKLRGHDGYAAIQCKFYDPQHRIAQADLAGFIAVSDKLPFHHRVVMDSTVVDWSSNAEAMLLGHHRYIIRIGLTELRASPIQWGQFAAKGEVVLAPKKELRPHQADALNAVRTGFADHERGKMIMACGTGKSDPRIVAGNPPDAVSQHANYAELAGRIGETTTAHGCVVKTNALNVGDILATRSGRVRLGNSGVLAGTQT